MDVNLLRSICLYCEEKKQRQYIQGHQNEHCMKRPISCEYCHDYESNFDDVINNHWPVCGFHPVRCPNECDSFPQRQNRDSHVADECPLTTISCDFVHVGCVVKLPRKDMSEHLRENLLTHTSLLAVNHAKQQAQITELLVENDALRGKNVNLEQNHHSLETNSDSLRVTLASLQESHTTLAVSHAGLQADSKQLKTENQTLKEENTQLRQELTALSQEVKTKVSVEVVPRTSIPLGPPVLIMTGFQQHKINNDYWHSPPVYTHHQGYKICLKVYANGFMEGKGKYITTAVKFMKGEFDNSQNGHFVVSFHSNYWIRSKVRIIKHTQSSMMTLWMTMFVVE